MVHHDIDQTILKLHLWLRASYILS